MYYRKLFENMEKLLDFLNSEHNKNIKPISIIPFQVNDCAGWSQLEREYELVFYV